MELATYTIRTFSIAHEYYPQERREVRQFQFTAWPDHGVPDHPPPLLLFMRRVKSMTPPDSGAIVVHCSAGVGRTGAFIVIDSMLERIKHERSVDVYGHVTCLRAQRNYMVQTEDQYIFIHDALLEAVMSGNTEIPARNLYNHIQKLQQVDTDEGMTAMELEFRVSDVTVLFYLVFNSLRHCYGLFLSDSPSRSRLLLSSRAQAYQSTSTRTASSTSCRVRHTLTT